jgi:cytoskeletal protein RodZ
MQHEEPGQRDENVAHAGAGEQHEGPADRSGDETMLAGTPVVVRRNAGLSAVIGAAASAIAIAYLWRAVDTGSVLDWALCGIIGLIAGFYLSGLLDSRTPLVVADDLGVRIRLGQQWRGLPWEAVGAVEVHPRRSLLRDGRLVFRPQSLGRALDGLEVRGRRHASLNQKMYGGALAVPLGLTTRTSTSTDPDAVAEGLAALSRGRAEVLVVVHEPAGTTEPDTAVDANGADAADRDVAPQVGAGSAGVQAADAGREERTTLVDRLRALLADLRPSSAQTEDEHVAIAPPADLRTPTARAREAAPASPAQAEDLDGRVAGEDADRAAASRQGSGTWSVAGPPASADAEPGATTGSTAARVRRAVEPAARAAAAETTDVDHVDPVDHVHQEAEAGAATPATRRSLLGGIGTIVSRVAKGARRDVDQQSPPGDETIGATEADEGAVSDGRGHRVDREERPAAGLTTPVLPLRSARPALRAEVTRDVPATTLGAAALHGDASDGRTELPEGRELRRPGSVDLVFERVDPSAHVRPIARLGDPVEPLVIDDFVTEPAYDPVIGPELAAARTRVGLSVDELADRTRIRPHVIESIEVDDFAPCGGDFYARGHLRTLARVLGQDPTPLLAKFDERYATAPINARRVFEAELATGMTGSMRSTVGGPNWGLLVGAVLTLVLVWGLVRLFATEPAELIESPTPVLNGSAGVGDSYPQVDRLPAARRPLPVMLVASQAGSRVVVRDGEGKIVFAGELVLGERKSLKVDPPVRVQAGNAGAVEVRVRGVDKGPVGELGQPGRRTFTRTSR